MFKSLGFGSYLTNHVTGIYLTVFLLFVLVNSNSLFAKKVEQNRETLIYIDSVKKDHEHYDLLKNKVVHREQFYAEEKIDEFHNITFEIINICISMQDLNCALDTVHDSFVRKGNILKDDLFFVKLIDKISVFVDTGYYELSLKLIEKVLLFTNEPQYSGKLNYIKGGILQDLGYYELSIKSYRQSINNLHHSGYVEDIVEVYLGLGSLYHQIEDYDGATLMYGKALSEIENKQIPVLEAEILTSLGITAMRKKLYQESLEYLRNALSVAEGIDHKSFKARNYYSIGNLFLAMKDPGKAESYFQNSLDLCLNIDHKYGQIAAYSGLSMVQKEFKKYKVSKEYLQKAINISDQHNLVPVKVNLLEMLNNLLIDMGQKEKADSVLIDMNTLSDSLLSAEKRNDLLLIQRDFERELQEKEYALQTVSQELNDNLFTFIFRIILIIALLSIGVYYYLKRERFSNKPGLSLDLSKYKYEIPGGSTETRNKTKNLFNKDSQSDIKSDVKNKEYSKFLDLYLEIEQLFQEKQLFKNPNLTTNMIAIELNTNRKYVSKAINEVAGMTYSQFLNEYRIKEAIKMFKNSGKKSSIKKVMADSGYQNTSTFYRAFKDKTDQTPGEFLNEMGT